MPKEEKTGAGKKESLELKSSGMGGRRGEEEEEQQ